MLKRQLWSIMTILSMAVSVYATALLLMPAFRPEFLRASPVPLVLLAHFAGGGLALAVGPFQFLRSLRTRRPALHRWLGRLYVAAIVAGGSAGLVLAFFSQGGTVAHLGFGVLAAAWLLTTTAAYRRIRRGDVVAHRQWMIRSFALTLAAVTLRIYLPASQAAGISFEAAYPVIAWACWLPNMVVAEWWFVPRTRVGYPAVAA